MGFPFTKAAAILDTLTKNGFRAYVVGGAVRDYLLGRRIHDIDIATSARPADVVALFKKTIPVGIEHGTVMVVCGGHEYEVTTFRSEKGYDDFRHPNTVTFETSLEKDVMRRDFTINALAMDRSGHVIDLFGGQEDLKRKVIRTVGPAEERIAEDPLRIMRGIRFTSELGFELGRAEFDAFRDHCRLLKKISVERIDQEMTRLLAGAFARGALQLLIQTGCLHVLPVLEGPIDETELLRVRFSLLQSDEERWAAFLSATGVTGIHHFAKAWKWSRSREKAVFLLQKYDSLRQSAGWDRVSVYFAGPDRAKAVERLQAAFQRETSDILKDRLNEIDRLWRALPIHARGELAVTGHDLKEWSEEKPGPWMSEALAQIEKEVILGSVSNRWEDIQTWFKVWRKQSRRY
ncbi:CCA tRNA nucleotidyltransferase [Sporolactobacillus sp. THM7-4]|nr:CCA tRNA nucleotidyltransferase [Sporolactobacillus sp. THM7-4]